MRCAWPRDASIALKRGAISGFSVLRPHKQPCQLAAYRTQSKGWKNEMDAMTSDSLSVPRSRLKILRVSHYGSVEEALTIEGVDKILPGTTTLAAGSEWQHFLTHAYAWQWLSSKKYFASPGSFSRVTILLSILWSCQSAMAPQNA